MEVSYPTNTTLEHIAEVILETESIALCGHINPDGDCIGSVLGLYLGLLELKKEVYPLITSQDPLHPAIAALPGAKDLIMASEVGDPVSLFISVDVSSPDRQGSAAAELRASSPRTIAIDHHELDHGEAELNYIVPDAPSTTMLIWDLLKALDVRITPEIASCCYFGLMTDTGGFRHANAHAEAFAYASEMVQAGANPNALSESFFQRRSMASLLLEERAIAHVSLLGGGKGAITYISREDMDETGAVKADCEPLIDVIRSIDGVCICCILKDLGEGIRGSIRSKEGYDALDIARSLGGGGHRLAAGFTLDCDIDEAIQQVGALIEEAVA